MAEELIKASPEQLLAMAEAVRQLRDVCRPIALLNHGPERFATDPELYVTDCAAQAMFNDCVERNTGDPNETVQASVHILAIIIAQQPDARDAADKIIASMLTFAASLRQRHTALIQVELRGEPSKKETH